MYRIFGIIIFSCFMLCEANQDSEIQQSADGFYQEYLAKYYPKALVIRDNFFTNKDPQQVAGILLAFVDLLAEKPWFYVTDKPDGFKISYYWEFIIDQCSLINAYLAKAYVNNETKRIYIPCYADFFHYTGSKNSKRLLSFLKSNCNEAVGRFYAFSFDYVLKLFNEGILFKDLKKAMRYFSDLEYIMRVLQGTSYEAEYQEYMKIAQELFALLKQQLLLNNSKQECAMPHANGLLNY